MGLLTIGCSIRAAFGQRAYAWQELRARFLAENPSLEAGRLNIGESRAREITAHLRPNPEVTITLDQINPFAKQPPPAGFGGNRYTPLAYAFPLWSTNYLHERSHKRSLRTESARQATEVATFEQGDLQRNLLFNLRAAFVQTLQAKAILALTKDNLTYYDRVLSISNDRLRAGDIAQVDLERLQLQRVQYESDIQTGEVKLRSAKIQLLLLLNDRTPVDQFDVTGTFDFTGQILLLSDLYKQALVSRPDLQAATQAVEKADVDHRLAVANGSTDPIFSMNIARNPPIPAYFGFSMSVPLRIFDRNQGEKARTQVSIQRTERLRDVTVAQILSDVASAYTTLSSNLELLRRYQSTYLDLAAKVRDTISFSYQQGGASLLEFLNAQSEYRNTQLSYLNLVGSFLAAANQLNFAVGREVIQ